MRRLILQCMIFFALASLVAADTPCPKCGTNVADGWKYCPADGTLLVKKCGRCSRQGQPDWLFCPYDGVGYGSNPAPGPAKVAGDTAGISKPGSGGKLETPAVATGLDVTAPDKTVSLWFDFVAQGEQKRVEGLLSPDFFQDESGAALQGDALKTEKERYFRKLFDTETRIVFSTAHRDITAIRIGGDRAEIKLMLTPAQDPNRPVPYTFRLVSHNGQWLIAAVY